jgi:ureidoglycolate hydrolase
LTTAGREVRRSALGDSRMRQVRLPITPITADAFAPFGRLFQPAGPRSFGRDNFDGWVMPFSADAPPRLQYVRYKPRANTVELIERHLFVTETRQQISGGDCVLVVAPPSAAPPDPAAMTAFNLRGHGIMLHPGTWHSIDAYPLGDAPGDYLFLSDEATVSELFDGTPQPRRSRVHDLVKAGVRLSFG